jgi:hypothetical protein
VKVPFACAQNREAEQRIPPGSLAQRQRGVLPHSQVCGRAERVLLRRGILTKFTPPCSTGWTQLGSGSGRQGGRAPRGELRRMVGLWALRGKESQRAVQASAASSERTAVLTLRRWPSVTTSTQHARRTRSSALDAPRGCPVRSCKVEYESVSKEELMITRARLPHIWGSLCLLLGSIACSGESRQCVSMAKGYVVVGVHGLSTCEGVQITFSDDDLLKAVASERSADGEACGATYLPPDSLSLDSVHVAAVDANGAILAEDTVDREYDANCGQYENATVELTVGN